MATADLRELAGLRTPEEIEAHERALDYRPESGEPAPASWRLKVVEPGRKE